MILKLAKQTLIGAGFLAASIMPGFTADLYEPPVVDIPPPPVYEVQYGGWYIRGDIDYHASKFRGGEYITYGCPPAECDPEVPPGMDDFDRGTFRNALSLGGGIGYRSSKYLRTDFTADYWFKSKFTGRTSGADCGGDPCESVDESAYSALLLLANAYIDLGTWHKVTPYVGAGIGGAYVKWDDLRNTIPGGTFVHRGEKDWRFAWSVTAGASYCLTKHLKADLGYRFSRISGGKMFSQYSPEGVFLGVGPGRDKGMNVHEVRGGLRYEFGGDRACGEHEPVDIVYQPDTPQPVYK
jgi:opacity protein-like surface antigen